MQEITMTKKPSHYDVFVSYAKADADFARRLVETLQAKNISVWYDQGELRLGESMLRRLEDGLEHSDFFLLLLSPDYFKKPWTQFETGVALGRGGKTCILPVFLKHFERKELARIAPSVADTGGIEADKHSLEEIATMVSDRLKTRSEEKQGQPERSRDTS
jgi:hypothetical protein